MAPISALPTPETGPGHHRAWRRPVTCRRRHITAQRITLRVLTIGEGRHCCNHPQRDPACRAEAILIPKVPVRMVPGHIRCRRTNRNHDCRPARAPNEPDPPARPNRGATLFYIGNTRHTHARGEDLPVSHQDAHSSPAAEGWSPRPPRHLPPVRSPRRESGTRFAGARWQPPSRPPPTARRTGS